MERRDFSKALALVPVSGALLTLPGCAPTTDKPQGGSTQTGRKFAQATRTHEFDDPGGYDHVYCDQFGIDHEGNPIADGLTGTGSDAGLKEHDPDNPHKMILTQEEQDILDGSQGETMAKVLKTVVMHGELFGAERLAVIV